jgi:SAM-dependent methyltransferase
VSYRRLLVADGAPPFAFVDPPFNLNHPEVAQYPADVTGYYLLDCLRRRLGWASLEGKRLLDLGCGVRFARTIHNLNLPVALYTGVDVNAEVIAWLQEHVHGPRFRFAHLNARNALYNPAGQALGAEALAELGLGDCEAACMFSVITHQSPDEARLTFAQLRRVIPIGGPLYFTALVDEAAGDYREGDPAAPGDLSTYHPSVVVELAESQGWRVSAIYPKGGLQQTVFVCSAV